MVRVLTTLKCYFDLYSFYTFNLLMYKLLIYALFRFKIDLKIIVMSHFVIFMMNISFYGQLTV